MPMQRYKPEQIVNCAETDRGGSGEWEVDAGRTARRLGYILRRIIGGGRNMEA